MVRRGSVAGLVVLLSAMAWAAGHTDVYVGTVTPPPGASSASVQLTLTAREYTSDEHVLELAQLLHKNGHAAFVTEMAKAEVGTVRLGAVTFRANVIRLQKTDKGQIVRVVTDRPMQLTEAAQAPTRPGDSVGYIELQLGATGEGGGRLFPVAKVVFDTEGFLAPEGVGEAWKVSSVKPSK